MPEFPSFRENQEWTDISATEMNKLSSSVNELVNKQSQNTTPYGGKSLIQKVVVLVNVPTEDSKFLVVREVRYATTPPKQGEYVLYGSSFGVFPEIGYNCLDYAQYYFDLENDVLDNTANYLTANFHHNYWYINIPKSSSQYFAVVRQKSLSNSRVITVSGLVRNDLGVLEISPNVYDINTWPGLIVADYYDLAVPLPVTTLNDRVYLCISTNMNGDWYLQQPFRASFAIDQTNFRQTDCLARLRS